MVQQTGSLWQKLLGGKGARTGAHSAALGDERLAALRSLETRYSNSPRRAEFCPDELSLATGLNRNQVAQKVNVVKESESEFDSVELNNPLGCSPQSTLADRMYGRAGTDVRSSRRELDRQSIRRWFSSRTSYDEQAIMDRLQPTVDSQIPAFKASRQPIDYDYQEVQAASIDPYGFAEECHQTEQTCNHLGFGTDNYAVTPVTFESLAQSTFYGSESGLVQLASTFDFTPESRVQDASASAQLQSETKCEYSLLDSFASGSLLSPQPITLDPLGLSGMLEPSILSDLGIYQSDDTFDEESEIDRMPPLEAIDNVPELSELLERLRQLECENPPESIVTPVTEPLTNLETESRELDELNSRDVLKSADLQEVQRTRLLYQSSKVVLVVTEEIANPYIPKLVVSDEIEIPRLVVAMVADLEAGREEPFVAKAVSIKQGKGRRKGRARKPKVRA